MLRRLIDRVLAWLTPARIERLLIACGIAVSLYTVLLLLITMISFVAAMGDVQPLKRSVLRVLFLLTYGAFPALACAMSAWTAYALITRLPERRDTNALAVTMSAISAGMYIFFAPTLFTAASSLGAWAPSHEHIAWYVGNMIATTVATIVLPPVSGAYLRFTALFPRAPTSDDFRTRSPLRRRLATLYFVRLPQSWVIWPFGLAAVGLCATLGEMLPDGLGALAAIAFIGLGWVNLMAGHKAVGEEDRQRTRLIRFAMITGMVCAVLFWPVDALAARISSREFPFGLVGGPLLLSGSIVIASMAIVSAVFQKGAIAPELVLRRSAIYGALTTIAVFTFAGAEALLSGALARGLGLPQGAATFLIAGVLAVTFGAIRKKVGSLVERLLPAERVALPPT